MCLIQSTEYSKNRMERYYLISEVRDPEGNLEGFKVLKT